MTAALRWDIFCRVIDNHGDVGVCWRLASQLAARGGRCRLWVDDASALAWMVPTRAGRDGTNPVAVAPFEDAGQVEPADVVIEAFGCDPPAGFVSRMHRALPPVWINLEYLTAEPYAQRSHGLPSPQQAGPGAGLVKWFYFPGFTAASGGLLRQPSRTARRHKTSSFLASRAQGERAVFVFAYDHARLDALLDALDAEPTLVLAAQGPSMRLLKARFGASRRGRHLRLQTLPWLDQPSFDALLHECDLAIVRGEDSLVQALWSGKPFLWNIYAQDDGAHVPKIEALLDLMLDGADDHVAADVRRRFRALNGLDTGRTPTAGDAPGLPRLDSARLASWQAAIAPWLAGLRSQQDLVTRLTAFVRRRRQDEGPATRPPS